MKPGRTTITCVKCNRTQSTHSTNRDKCHRCKPKCREKNVFNGSNKLGGHVTVSDGFGGSMPVTEAINTATLNKNRKKKK